MGDIEKHALSRRPIFLTGYMASGKTTLGKALARALGRTFIDLDFYIEQRFRKPIGAMFAEEGEESFRRREAAMLRECGEFEDVVIACGGGTPCFHENMDYMLATGTPVFLHTSVRRIVQRLEINSSRRPLMAGKSGTELREAVERGLAERGPVYERAPVHFSGDELEDIRQIETSVAALIKILNQKNF